MKSIWSRLLVSLLACLVAWLPTVICAFVLLLLQQSRGDITEVAMKGLLVSTFFGGIQLVACVGLVVWLVKYWRKK